MSLRRPRWPPRPRFPTSRCRQRRCHPAAPPRDVPGRGRAGLCRRPKTGQVSLLDDPVGSDDPAGGVDADRTSAACSSGLGCPDGAPPSPLTSTTHSGAARRRLPVVRRGAVCARAQVGAAARWGGNSAMSADTAGLASSSRPERSLEPRGDANDRRRRADQQQRGPQPDTVVWRTRCSAGAAAGYGTVGGVRNV